MQKRSKPDPATYIGSGKAAEIQLLCQSMEVDLVIMDDELTGAQQRNLEQALRMTYDAMPEPKMVMACGACACGGETYGSTYAVVGRAADVVPVDIAVPGCPPRPAAIIVALCAAADMLKERM